MKTLKTCTTSTLAIAALLFGASAMADYTTSFTVNSVNMHDYSGSWGPGDCGWSMTGAGGSGYGGGASYVATKNCPYSQQSLSWTYSGSSWASYYTVNIRQYGPANIVCEKELVPVVTTTYVEQCVANP